MKTINLKFCAPFKIFTETGGTSNFEDLLFIFLHYIQERTVKEEKSKVCPLDTQIKLSGLRISHS